MAENVKQTMANHVRLHPPFHFFALPLSAAALVMAIVNVVKHNEALGAWTILIMALVLPVTTLLTRTSALKAQDRVIRLEERLRLASVLNDPLRSRIDELTEAQLIAIRFCPDGELAGVVDKSLKNNLSNKDIKKSIVNWRADNFRI